MRTLPTKFIEENAKQSNQPAFVVRLLEREIHNEQTSSAHWNAAVLKDRTDLTTTPGDVLIQKVGNSWAALTGFGTARKGLTAVAQSGKLYAHGGIDNMGNSADPYAGASAELWEYNIASATWTNRTAAPVARAWHCAGLHNNKLYVWGGASPTGYTIDYTTLKYTLYECDLSTFTWTLKNTSAYARYGSASVIYNGKMIIFGGNNGTSKRNEVYEYDLTTFAFTDKTPSYGPSAREGASAILYGNCMVVFGGYGSGDQYFNDVWELNLDNYTWAQRTSGPSGRAYCNAAIYDDRMYIFGGVANNIFTALRDEVWEYNITAGIWTQKTSGATARCQAAGVISDNKLYVVGGIGSGPALINSMYSYQVPTYDTTAVLTTQTMDIGEIPVDPGEWVLSTTVPTGTALSCHAWGSTTGAFTGEEVDLGTIVDGQEISNLKRYYRVQTTLTPNNLRTVAPSVQSIKADFGVYKNYSDHMSLGYEPELFGVSSLTTSVDVFNASTISQITLTFSFTDSISTWLSSSYPKNKLVQILVGFVAPGFTLQDYVDYFWGQVDDYTINSDDTVTVVVKDFQKDWQGKVPSKWQSAADDVTWTAQHPVDVMLDIMQNRLPIRDSKIDKESFSVVKTALSGWKVTRTITGDPVEAKKLLEELRLLTSTFFIPQADGKIKLKRWDATEAAVADIVENDIKGFTWSGNLGSLINKYQHYYAWDGAGDSASDFAQLSIAIDSASQTNWGEIKLKEVKDKWTLAAESAQVTDLYNKIIARFANPPALVSFTLDRRWVALETGDIITVSHRRAPSTNMQGVTQKKFQIINSNLDLKTDKIKLKALAV